MITHECTLQVAADHPSLAGHFPGRPIVPGVLLLERIVEAAESAAGRSLRVTALQQVKFTTPLLPGETASLSLKLSGTELRFSIARGDQLVSQGVLAVEPTN